MKTKNLTSKIYKNLKTLPVVNVDPTEYLYFPLDVEGATLKGSFLPAHISSHNKIVINSHNNNKSFHQHNFYIPIPILPLINLEKINLISIFFQLVTHTKNL